VIMRGADLVWKIGGPSLEQGDGLPETFLGALAVLQLALEKAEVTNGEPFVRRPGRLLRSAARGKPVLDGHGLANGGHRFRQSAEVVEQVAQAVKPPGQVQA